MNRTSKLVLSAAIVAGGYWVASLCGSPSSFLLQRATWSPGAGMAGAALRPGEISAGETGGVRLLPGVAANSPPAAPPALSTNQQNSTGQAPATIATRSVVPPGPVAPPTNIDPTPMESPASTERQAAGPRASLRNVAPRVVGRPSGPEDASLRQAPFTAVAAPVIQQTHTAPVANPSHAEVAPQATKAASQVVQSGYLATGMPEVTLAGHPTVMPSLSPAPPSNTADSRSGTGTMLSSVSLATLEPARPPISAVYRLHIVKDGDSLPKLAKRYLHDPSRSDELFGLNRDVLTNPDLLPIGVELKIPPPTSAF